jgi:hypothetical protein
MTSQINFSSINANYPVAGQDNDSQGFRDNFGVIKVALSTASNEITSLELNTAKTNADNNFNDSIIEGAVFRNNTDKTFGSLIAPVSVNSTPWTIYANQADYQILSVSTNTTFTFEAWPAENYRKIQLEVIPTTSTTMNITFSSDGVIRKQASQLLPYTSTHAVSQLWDVWTTDAGATTYVRFVGTWTNV